MSSSIKRRTHNYSVPELIPSAQQESLSASVSSTRLPSANATLPADKIAQASSEPGLVIAFVGPEATGKSTLVDESARWLGGMRAVQTIHAGKPPATWLTMPIHGVLPMIRKLVPRLRTNRLEGHVSETPTAPKPRKIGGLSSLVYALRAVSMAWDRKHLLASARRTADRGTVIICDRYPSATVGAMDSPRLQTNPAQRGAVAAVYNWLARVEQRLYDQIPPPDAVLRLTVSVETAKARNQARTKLGKEAAAYIESRRRQSAAWQRSDVKHMVNIDTDQSLAETIHAAQAAIWGIIGVEVETKS